MNENSGAKLEFVKLLDTHVNGLELGKITPMNIGTIYNSYDPSNDYYSEIPYPLDKVTVSLYMHPDANCSIPCKDETHVIEISDSDSFSITNTPRSIKRFVSFPFMIAKLLWEEEN